MAQPKLSLFAAALALLLSPFALTQEKSTAAQSQPETSPTAEITIRGCVTGGQRYTFMQASTGAIFSLTGDTGRFAPVTGKLIEITANERAPQPNGSELPELQVNTLHVVAEKCPIEAHKETTANSPARARGQQPATSPATEPYVDPGTASQTPPNVNNPNITGDSGAPSPGTGNPPPTNPPQ